MSADASGLSGTPTAATAASTDLQPDVQEAEHIIGIAREFTNDALDAARQICLAGVAIIWLFKLTVGTSNFVLPRALLFPTLFFLLGLGFNFVYFAGGALLWRLDYRFFQGGAELSARQRRVRDKILKVDKVGPAEIRTFAPTSYLFWGTILFSTLGSLSLLAFLANRILFAWG
jgi:hypothetical protein